jgi:hypothetical protein
VLHSWQLLLPAWGGLSSSVAQNWVWDDLLLAGQSLAGIDEVEGR